MHVSLQNIFWGSTLELRFKGREGKSNYKGAIGRSGRKGMGDEGEGKEGTDKG